MYETEIVKPVNPVADRERQHAPAGSRSIDEQVLDALLRQEEALNAILAGLRHFATKLEPAAPAATPEAPKSGRRR